MKKILKKINNKTTLLILISIALLIIIINESLIYIYMKEIDNKINDLKQRIKYNEILEDMYD